MHYKRFCHDTIKHLGASARVCAFLAAGLTCRQVQAHNRYGPRGLDGVHSMSWKTHSRDKWININETKCMIHSCSVYALQTRESKAEQRRQDNNMTTRQGIPIKSTWATSNPQSQSCSWPGGDVEVPHEGHCLTCSWAMFTPPPSTGTQFKTSFLV